MNADSGKSQLIDSCNHDGTWWYSLLHTMKLLEVAPLTLHFCFCSDFPLILPTSAPFCPLSWGHSFMWSFLGGWCVSTTSALLLLENPLALPSVVQRALLKKAAFRHIGTKFSSVSCNLSLCFEQVYPIQKARALYLSWIRPICQIFSPSWPFLLDYKNDYKYLNWNHGNAHFFLSPSISTPFLWISSGHIQKIGLIKAWTVILI